MAITKGTLLNVGWALALVCGVANCKTQEATDKSKDKAKEIVALPSASVWDAAAPIPSDAAPFVLPPAPPIAATPLGLPPPPSPSYNPTTAEKVALGARLFADVALSSNGKVSCASCHDPSHGYANGEPFNSTATGRENQRHTPSLVGVAYHRELYWDGRSQPLEAHILGHWEGQLGLAPSDAIAAVVNSPVYQAHFQRCFEGAADQDRAAEALAAYVRTLLDGNSPWDRYEAGDVSAVSQEAISGSVVFNKRAGCATCHAPPLYTDLKFHNLGLPESTNPDVGREGHTGRVADRGAFKTPSLRAVSHTPPYFHNGSATTLLQVLEHKETQGSPRLSANERSQLLAFLAALTGEALP